jgi:hypothetical protein
MQRLGLETATAACVTGMLFQQPANYTAQDIQVAAPLCVCLRKAQFYEPLQSASRGMVTQPFDDEFLGDAVSISTRNDIGQCKHERQSPMAFERATKKVVQTLFIAKTSVTF